MNIRTRKPLHPRRQAACVECGERFLAAPEGKAARKLCEECLEREMVAL